MAPRLHRLSLFTITLCFSLTSPQQLAGTSSGIKAASAQETTIAQCNRLFAITSESNKVYTDTMNSYHKDEISPLELALRLSEYYDNAAAKLESLSFSDPKLQSYQSRLVLKDKHRSQQYRLLAAGDIVRFNDMLVQIKDDGFRLQLGPSPVDTDTQQDEQLEKETNKYCLDVRASRASRADQLQEKGMEQLKANQLQAALQSLQEAYTIYQKIGDRRSEILTLKLIGLVYSQLEEFSYAIEFFQKSINLARENNFYELEELVQERLWLTQRQSNPKIREADRLFERSVDQFENSQFKSGMESSQQALMIYRETGDRYGEARSLNALGNAYSSIGNYKKAIEFQQQSLNIFQEIGNYTGKEGTVISLNGLGNAYLFLGAQGKAIEYYQQSLDIYQEIGDREGEALALNNLGNSYLSQEDYAEAINYYEKSLNINLEIRNRRGEEAVLTNLAKAYSGMGNYGKAIEYYQQSWKILQEIDYPKGKVATLQNWGNAYIFLGDYGKARDYFQQSLNIAQTISFRQGEAVCLQAIGTVYLIQGDYGKGIEYFQQSLDIFQKIGDRQGKVRNLQSLGDTYAALGDYVKAIKYYQQGLPIAQEIGDLQGQSSILNNLGMAFFNSGNFPDAERKLREAIAIRESIRTKLGWDDANKVLILDTIKHKVPYHNLQLVLAVQNQPEAALEIAEQGRARAFSELLAQYLHPESAKRARMIGRMRSEGIRVVGGLTTVEPLTREQIQQIASEQKATLVEYSIVDFGNSEKKLLLIWVIQPAGKIAFHSVDLSTLNTSLKDLVTNSRQSLGVRGRDSLDISFEPTPDQSDRLKQLHKLLIEPIAQYLPTNPSDRVIFIPQNELFLVPFPALQDDGGKYLIQKHTILTAPSIQVLQLTHEKRQTISGDGMLVVGNPTMPSVTTTVGESSQQLKNLPGAQKEATDIAQLLNTKALTGNLATKAAVLPKLSNARIIHLATHGLLDDFRGLGVPGAIALAPDGTGELNDGLLTSSEIFDLKLNAELVVLSACDTGRGRVTGDGVIGLSRSLITAGVPSIIVSLWSVPDAPTASLMTQFYQNLQKNPDKAQALRQAMLTTMATHPNPRDWAAFTLIGEAQ